VNFVMCVCVYVWVL